MPYALASNGERGRPHFLCYQYNAFELLDLAEYHRLTGDDRVIPIIQNLARFLTTGITDSGAARYDCHQAGPEMPYYTAVVAAALGRAARLGLGSFSEVSERAYRCLLNQQSPDGRIAFFSRGNYRWLTDRRSYPRNLAMILCHLLFELRSRSESLTPVTNSGQMVIAR